MKSKKCFQWKLWWAYRAFQLNNKTSRCSSLKNSQEENNKSNKSLESNSTYLEILLLKNLIWPMNKNGSLELLTQLLNKHNALSNVLMNVSVPLTVIFRILLNNAFFLNVTAMKVIKLIHLLWAFQLLNHLPSPCLSILSKNKTRDLF